MIVRVLIIFFIISVNCPDASGGNFGFGVHSGYGVIKYEEQVSAFGNDIESKSTQNLILFGGSGEYSFCLKDCSPQANPPRRKNFYVNITTDWVLGLEDIETWRDKGIQFQTNDMRFFGQFYDLRFGYKNSFNNLYYRLYVAGGWDGLHFKRDNFIWRGTPITGSVTEDISLWRTGVGTGVGYKLDKWALDGRLAYAYYPVGNVENSSLPQFTFDTNGTCLDISFGIARVITKSINFFAGASYTLLKLNQSNITRSGSIQAVYPRSKTEIINGVINLTYAF